MGRLTETERLYNAKWYKEKGAARAKSASVAANRKRYFASPRGRLTKNRLAREWYKTPQGRAARVRNAATRRARERKCECCDSVQFKAIYEAAEWMACEVDHRIPLALGGLHCAKNLQILTPVQHLVKTKMDKAQMFALGLAKRAS